MTALIARLGRLLSALAQRLARRAEALEVLEAELIAMYGELRAARGRART